MFFNIFFIVTPIKVSGTERKKNKYILYLHHLSLHGGTVYPLLKERMLMRVLKSVFSEKILLGFLPSPHVFYLKRKLAFLTWLGPIFRI